MTEEQRKALGAAIIEYYGDNKDAERHSTEHWIACFSHMFSAGAAWGAAARQRFDANACENMGLLDVADAATANSCASFIRLTQMPEVKA